MKLHRVFFTKRIEEYFGIYSAIKNSIGIIYVHRVITSGFEPI